MRGGFGIDGTRPSVLPLWFRISGPKRLRTSELGCTFANSVLLEGCSWLHEALGCIEL